MKLAVLTVTYRDQRFISQCIRQFTGIVDKHLVLISDTPWHGVKEPLDSTGALAESLGAEVVLGDWESEAEQRNTGVMMLQGYDWILVVDTDERYLPQDIERMITFLSDARHPSYGIGRLLTYWKDTETIVDPEETGGLIVAIKPYVRFTDKRCIDSSWDFLPNDIVMHHLSYVRTNEEMKRKIQTFEHQHEIVPNWYEEKWLQGTENLHPVNPSSFKGLKKVKAVVCA